MLEISSEQRRDFRARAHHLNPVATIAGKGLTASVLAEIDRCLQAHELIKVKVQGIERNERAELLQSLCESLEAAPVQHIGSILVVWRPRRETEAAAPAPERKPTARPATAKSASAFAAAARRAALAKASVEARRPAPVRSRNARGR